MAQRLQVTIWADPWLPDGYILREVWVGGSTDDGYWPNDKQVSESELTYALWSLQFQRNATITDCRKTFFPFKRLGG